MTTADDRTADSRTDPTLEEWLADHEGELTGYCYRMLGSAFDADDAVQETMLRAWRGYGRFEGRSSLRTWLYRIATNVCLNLLEGTKRRARPVDMSEPLSRPDDLGDPLTSRTWIEPMPDARLFAGQTDPVETVVAQESVRLAFIAALQCLPPLQRAVLLQREVVGSSAQEIADLMGTTVASVNSALQRARSALATRQLDVLERQPVLTDVQNALVTSFIDAFERFDMEALTMLLHVDATLSASPHAGWIRGPEEIRAWLLGPAVGCRGSRLLRVCANGSPAFAQYRRSTTGNGFDPWALQVLEVAGGRITALNIFRDTERLFPLFGLPDRLDD